MKGKMEWHVILLVALRAALVAVAALLADHTAGGRLTDLALAPAALLGLPVAVQPVKAVSSSKSYSSSLYVPANSSAWIKSQLVRLG